MTTEKELDRALEEALANSEAFRLWFLGKLKHVNGHTRLVLSRSDHPWCRVRLILPNAKTGALEAQVREGETDLLVVFENDAGHRLGVHIENKRASGKFTSEQPELYAARADHWIGSQPHGSYKAWETVLVAPSAFAEKNASNARKFTTFIPHEEIAQHVAEFAAPSST